MDIARILKISAAGMKAQSARMRVVAENLANAEAAPDTPGADPYRRKVISFKSELDRETGLETVAVGRISTDRSPFNRRYEPGHPGADANGYVKLPNVKGLIEVMDLRTAQRSYEANLNVIQVSRSMLQNTLEILRN